MSGFAIDLAEHGQMPVPLPSPSSSVGSRRTSASLPRSRSAEGPPAALGDRTGSNFKVVIRVRPPLPRELNGERPFQNVVAVDREEHAITVSENRTAILDSGQGQGDTDAQSDAASYAGRAEALSTHVYTFDHVYGQNASQQKVYENTARAVVDSSLQGCEDPRATDRPTDRAARALSLIHI